MKYDVFISYSTSDQTIVNDLSSYIEQHGLRCFVAHRNIPQGLIWSKAISEALNNSRLMLVVFSKAYNDSRQGDKEIELACKMQMPILTFRLSNDVYSGAKMYYLNNAKSVDATIYPKAAFGDVVLNTLRIINTHPAVEPTQPQAVPAPQPLNNQPQKSGNNKNSRTTTIIVLSVVAIVAIVILGVVLSSGDGEQQAAYTIGGVQQSNETAYAPATQPDNGSRIILHAVEEYETIYSIAKRYSTTTASIAELNPEVDFMRMRVGDKIRVRYDHKPTYYQQSATGSNDNKVFKEDVAKVEQRVVTEQTEDNVDHKVEEGENIYVIAKKYDTTSKRIEELNPDVDPTKIVVGQRIRVKGSPMRINNQHNTAVAHPEQRPTKSSITNTSAEHYNEPVYHTIEEGDTFGSLAVKYLTTSKKIQELNPDVDPTKLLIGLKIRVL